MGGRREVSIIFYRQVTRSDLKQELGRFSVGVSHHFFQLVVAQCHRAFYKFSEVQSFLRCISFYHYQSEETR